MASIYRSLNGGKRVMARRFTSRSVTCMHNKETVRSCNY